MAVNKEKNGTWTVQCWYREWTGARRKKTKRGFRTKAEALQWQTQFALKASGSLDMSFRDFVKVYEADRRPHLKRYTWHEKEYVIKDKILPYFGDKALGDITPADILAWQAMLVGSVNKRTGQPYKKSYLRKVSVELTAIFNHAVRYYNLPSNPMAKTGKIGSKKTEEMKFWTKEEYLRFSDAVADKPLSHAIFEVLYWCGIREGEALALTPEDFDFEKNLLTISKSYQRLGGEDVVTGPKTEKSNRTIAVPDDVADEIRDYIAYGGFKEGERIFPVTKSYLYREMRRGADAAGVKPIRIHDLRHSHVSLLIDLGFSVLAIADRMGHESSDITLRYAHLFPNKRDEMARALTCERRSANDQESA